MEKMQTGPNAERAALVAEIKKGCEIAQNGLTSWTDVLLTVFPDGEPANDNVMDDRTYSADVAKNAILSKINELTELEEQLKTLGTTARDIAA